MTHHAWVHWHEHSRYRLRAIFLPWPYLGISNHWFKQIHSNELGLRMLQAWGNAVRTASMERNDSSSVVHIYHLLTAFQPRRYVCAHIYALTGSHLSTTHKYTRTLQVGHPGFRRIYLCELFGNHCREPTYFPIRELFITLISVFLVCAVQ